MPQPFAGPRVSKSGRSGSPTVVPRELDEAAVSPDELVELSELEPVELSVLEPVELPAVWATVVIPIVVDAWLGGPPQAALRSPSSRTVRGESTTARLTGLRPRAKGARRPRRAPCLFPFR